MKNFALVCIFLKYGIKICKRVKKIAWDTERQSFANFRDLGDTQKPQPKTQPVRQR